jgi:hypothetical protein
VGGDDPATGDEERAALSIPNKYSPAQQGEQIGRGWKGASSVKRTPPNAVPRVAIDERRAGAIDQTLGASVRPRAL